jgi:protein tyrosine/serine phosphatase
MNEPAISPNFTIEDIHKIREYDAEKYWSMPKEEFWAEVRADSLYVQEKIKEAREKRFSEEKAGMSKAI